MATNMDSANKPAKTQDTPDKKEITQVRVLSVEFMSDHKLLKDNQADWKNTGALYKKPDWNNSHSNPISHSRGEKIQLKVKFKVWRSGAAPESGTLFGFSNIRVPMGKDKSKQLLFIKKGVNFDPGKKIDEVVLESKQKLPATMRVRRHRFEIRWIAKGKKQYQADTSKNLIFFTLGNPRDNGNPFKGDGVTFKRMNLAVNWIRGTNERKSMDIVEKLFDKFPVYVLSFNDLEEDQQTYLRKHPEIKEELKRAGFPVYMMDGVSIKDPDTKSIYGPDIGGPWLLAEYQTYGGECQAIVRLIQAILNQVGSPGKAGERYVNANAGKPYEAIFRNYGTECTGPNVKRKYILAAHPVKVGHLYTQDEVGVNNYEAYLKFTDENGEIGWFGGGVGKLPRDQHPITVFYALVEYEDEYVKKIKGWKFRITQLWKYKGKPRSAFTNKEILYDENTRTSSENTFVY